LEEKRTFFDGVVNHSSTLLAHFESEGALTLTFNRDIVEKVIGDLLFDPDDVSCQSTREKALAIFQHFDDAALDEESTGAAPSAIIPEQELNREAYFLRVNSIRMFKMVIGFVSKGASFRSASRFVAIAKDVTKMNYLSGCSEGRCATFVRIVFASSLQGIHEMLCGSWAYSIALDVGHAQGTSYLDVRVRFCTPSGTIANYHVLPIPLFENKTADTQFDLCRLVMDVVDPQWRVKLTSIGTDGERTMTGRISGVQTCFEQATEFPIVRACCGLHQLDHSAQAEYQKLCDDTFVTALTGLISWLRRQQRLQMEMQTTCPKFITTRWLSMKRITALLANHRVRIASYLEEKKPACMPTRKWWIVMLCLDSVATILSATCTGLQGLTTFLHQQVSQFEQLKATLSDMCWINGPHSSEECAVLNAEAFIFRDAFSVKLADAIAFIKDQGTFVIDSLAEIGDEEATDISRMIGNLFLGLFCGIAAIVATRTSQNEASSAELPPVLPHSLSKVRTAQVCE
jgi:hypothetical protein